MNEFNEKVKRSIDNILLIKSNMYNGVISLNAIIITAFAIVISVNNNIPVCLIFLLFFSSIFAIILIFICYSAQNEILNISLDYILKEQHQTKEENAKTESNAKSSAGNKLRIRRICERWAIILSFFSIGILFWGLYIIKTIN